MEELPMRPLGILIQREFITPENEAELIRIFQQDLQWPARSGRLSIHYGYTFNYKTCGIDTETPYNPFPTWLAAVLPRTEPTPPDQVCLQYYAPGTGIPPHVDTHGAYDQLYALSLGAPVPMQFRGGEGNAEAVDIELPPRSMVQLSGDARLHWTHGIRARKTDPLPDGGFQPRGHRWSITYRWLRQGGECECGNERLCDTAQRRKGVEKEYRWKQEKQAAAPAKQRVEPKRLP